MHYSSDSSLFHGETSGGLCTSLAKTSLPVEHHGMAPMSVFSWQVYDPHQLVTHLG